MREIPGEAFRIVLSWTAVKTFRRCDAIACRRATHAFLTLPPFVRRPIIMGNESARTATATLSPSRKWTGPHKSRRARGLSPP